MDEATGGYQQTLSARWSATLPARVDRAVAATAGADLLGRWSEPHRHYHTVAHLTAMLDVVDANADLAADPDAVRLAAWFHDAVYDPRAADSEERSAALAAGVLGALGIPDRTVAEVGRLVRLTVGHDPDAGDRNGLLLVDADLAVLAGTPDHYDGYAAAVRLEYRHLSDERYTAGRAGVLSRLACVPALYRALPERTAMHRRAVANLRRELARLAAR